MKRVIGMAVANWLRKPKNRQKVKRMAGQLWNKHKGRKTPGDRKP